MRRDSITWAGLLVVAFLTGCGGGGGGSSGPPPSPPLIQALLFSLPSGSRPPANFSNALANITDASTGAIISSASVTMNGVPLIFNVAPTRQEYEGNLAINPGDPVTLVVKVGGSTYTASGTQFTSYPTISTPQSGDTWSANAVNTVTWSGGAPLSNAAYLLGVLDATDPNGGQAYFQSVATSANSFSIPAYSSITPGSRDVAVGITTQALIPNAAANSSFVFGGFNYVPVTVTGMPVASHKSGTTNSLSGVTWSGTQFVAVASPGPILTSPDGIVWTSHDSGTTNSLTSVSWSGSQFVAVGSGGTILSSSDGMKWVAHNVGATDALYGVAWSGTQFVAVGFDGFNGLILTSPDGITWTPRISGNSNTLQSVVWSGTQFVVVGRGGAILTSPDGIAWTMRNSGVVGATYLLGITWSGTQFVVVGIDSTLCCSDLILTSPDGVSWTSRNSGAKALPGAVAWSGTEFLAVGGNGANAGTILTSSDGITWTQQASGTTNALSGVVWSGTKFVMVGNAGTILTSP